MSCLLAFILFASAAIFYSQGYRFDFKAKRIVQTGGIFLKVEPKQASVFLNDKLKDKTDFLFGNVLLKNLLPEKYKVRVEKEGFHPWAKNLEVNEKEVTEAKRVVLIPKNPRLKILTSEIKNFWFFPDGGKIIFLRENEGGWTLHSYSPDEKKERQILKEKDVAKTGAKFIGLRFSPSQQEALLKTEIKGAAKNFLLDLTKNPPPLKSAIGSETNTVFSSQKINGDLYYLDKEGHLVKSGKNLVEGIFKDFKVSPDFQKVVLITDYEIWVLFLREQSAAPKRKELEKIYLTRFSKKIGEIFWYNSEYLIFNVGEEIKIAEIDNRDRLNIVDLTGFQNSQLEGIKIFFNLFDKKLYVLNKDNLFISEKLLP